MKEALDLLHVSKYSIFCDEAQRVIANFKSAGRGHARGGSTISNNCDEVCGEEDLCELKIGGPKVYTSVLAVLYICTIIFYDLQKVRSE